MSESEKLDGALLAIGELAEKLGVPTHVLRYWETRFPELKPLQRSGRRRYYRPDDVALAERIRDLLQNKGYTVEGARRVISGDASGADDVRPVGVDIPADPRSSGSLPEIGAPSPSPLAQAVAGLPSNVDLRALRDLWERLARALAEA